MDIGKGVSNEDALVSFNLFGWAVSYSLKFSVISVRFIFPCASFEVQSNEDALAVVHVAPLHISGLLLFPKKYVLGRLRVRP